MRTVLLLAAGACLLGGAALAEVRPTLRIMPVGDSITDGVGGTQSGYRYFLERDLTAAGFAVDYVGTARNNACQGLLDADHEGHSGWYLAGASASIDSAISGWLSNIAAPDVVLLHIGTNDAKTQQPLTDRPAALESVIGKIVNKAPAAHIVVTTVLRRTDNAAWDANIDGNFNAAIPDIVARHAALGERVHFLDMRACLDYPADLSDGLHPNDSGYRKMADAWKGAITAIFEPAGDALPPRILRAAATDDTHLAVTFSKPMSAAFAENAANWTLVNGPAVTAAKLDGDGRVVTLAAAGAVAGADALEARNVADLRGTEPVALLTRPLAAVPHGYAAYVPEAEWSPYTLVYDFTPRTKVTAGDISTLYDVDNSGTFSEPFDRVAYYLELQKAGSDEVQYLWVSFDAFTNDVKGIDVPVDYVYQGPVSSMNVFCNLPDVSNGLGLSGGKLEFWPNYYAAGPDGNFSWNDAISENVGYGSMQIHNLGVPQTLLSYSGWWYNGGSGALGIGNRPAGERTNRDPDWTFAARNVETYSYRKMQIFVRPSPPDTTPPVVAGAAFSAGDETVTLTFSEPVIPASVTPAAFSGTGYRVLRCRVSADGLSVVLEGYATVEGEARLRVADIRDRAGNRMAPAEITVAVALGARGAEANAAAGIAAEVAALVGEETVAGYDLLFAADIPTACKVGDYAGPRRDWQAENFYRVDRRAVLAADRYSRPARVAYCLVLTKPDGTVQYAWTAMDAFTRNLEQMAVPEAGYFFQTCVSNLDVVSNVEGVRNVSRCQTGCIEFSASQYTMADSAAMREQIGGGTSDNHFDWNDSGFSTDLNNIRYGCMQVHNWGDRHTVWAFNHFNDGHVPGLGIGNEHAPGSGHTDWTLADNAATFSSRKLYGFVLREYDPVGLGGLRPAAFDAVDESDRYRLVYLWDVPEKGVTPYAVDESATDKAAFDRIAYYLELTGKDGAQKWVWVSMDAFTQSLKQIAVPRAADGCLFQQKVTDMNVYASENVASIPVSEGGVVTGRHIETGNVEIWPSLFDRGTGPAEFGGSASRYDWNDQRGSLNDNYGQLQVNNYGAEHTIFSISAFYYNWNLGIGIGNNLSDPDSLDWTLSKNAANYLARRLYVLVRGPASAEGPWGASPLFLRQPRDTRISRGGKGELRVEAVGATGWQWYRNGEPLAGEVFPLLEFAKAGDDAAGSYRCLVTTATGAAFSSAAAVTVCEQGTLLLFR